MDNKYFDENPTTNLSFWVLGQMLKGFGMAFVLVVGLMVAVGIIWTIGQALPGQSKEMPSPYGLLDVPAIRVMV